MKRRDTSICETPSLLDRLPPNYQAPALDKGLDIIEVLARSGKPMTLTKISWRLNKATTELFRMVRVLERREYIALSEDRAGYILTDKLSRLAAPRDHGKMPTDGDSLKMQRIRELEDENARLRRAVADLLLENTGVQNSESGER